MIKVWKDKMDKYKFTIITVCYNAEQYIEKTIKSVLSQQCNDYEYIIKDGKSTDNTMKIVYAMIPDSDRFKIISEPDEGIYDAMNFCVRRAKGEYIYFLNAGDYFVNNFVLRDTKSFLSQNVVDIAYGNIVQVYAKGKESFRRYGKICAKKLYFLSGDCICHQSMFVKRVLFEEKEFDLNYKVCADREWQLYFIDNKKLFIPMSFEVAAVLVDGFSANHLKDFESESIQCVEKYCKNLAWIYKCINRMKYNTFCVKMLRAIGNICFVRSKRK